MRSTGNEEMRSCQTDDAQHRKQPLRDEENDRSGLETRQEKTEHSAVAGMGLYLYILVTTT